MKKLVFYLVCGLMSLVGLCACEDNFSFNESDEIAPIGYLVKDASNIQIIGIMGLVIEEQPKTWEMLVQSDATFFGDSLLEFEESELEVGGALVMFKSNYGDIPVALKGLTVPFTYQGESINLECIDMLSIKVKVVEQSDDASDSLLFNGTMEYELVAEIAQGKTVVLDTKTHRLRIFKLIK